MRKALLSVAVAGLATLALNPSGAHALAITTTNDVGTLTSALLAPSSGINVVTSNLIGTSEQQGTYSGFNLAPSSGSSPTLTLGDGVLLTTGSANIPLTNTINNTSVNSPSPGYAPLTTLAGTNTNDSNVLEYSFTVDPGQNAVSMQFVFGTEEFPTQTVTDIFGFFVDGVNYAKFPSGELISNTPGNPTNFINNPVGAGLYGIEYNGLTRVFTVTGLLDASLATHTLAIGIADTSDSIFDSGVFLSGLKAGTATGGGGIENPVPEPATLGLFGLGLLGLAATRRRRTA
ncbi:PEP-CTERM protein-sorting domain-containing protein [Roseomonas rosea]|uniref:PEP-CTERM protein-sorting domain-containing protein n=1 Tax=Muricoccus roseus TaxID=198092 RepID=A0A1M6G808_9PROT|nr:choice-of-anchor L domain-containing protein [Roseomonas rosea]SHJ06066.1 PEP-CTERM protein-sorting domain-containing protein [Roseomonas rosea]